MIEDIYELDTFLSGSCIFLVYKYIKKYKYYSIFESDYPII